MLLHAFGHWHLKLRKQVEIETEVKNGCYRIAYE